MCHQPKSREGVIIERPLNDLFHDHCDVILTSRMAVSNIFLTVADIKNIGKLTDNRYLVYEITVMKRWILSKIYLTA